MSSRLLLLAVVALGGVLAAPAFTQTRPAASQPDARSGVIRGEVVDENLAPLAEVMVILCDHEGYPIGETSMKGIHDMRDGDSFLQDWVHAWTAADGTFIFTGLPRGTYKLMAQSWTDDAAPGGAPRDVHGQVLTVRGMINDLPVPSDVAEDITITPLGKGTLVYHRGAGNDDWHIMVSPSPPGDAVLGPVGWNDAFLRDIVAYNRMPAGEAIIHGLPGGRISYAIFANDSNPGFGAETLRVSEKRMGVTDANLVVSWSDGRHDPPARLAALTATIRVLREEHGRDFAQRLIMETAGPPKHEARNRLEEYRLRLGDLSREIGLPNGQKVTAHDLLAANGYVDLQDRVKPRRE